MNTQNTREPIGEAISELELSINAALIAVGDKNIELRKALLNARRNIRHALGEAGT